MLLKNASSGIGRSALWFSVRSLCLCGECFSASSHHRDRTEKSLARIATIFTLVCLLGTSALSQNGIPPDSPHEIHKCATCPPGAQCKACLGDYIVSHYVV